MNENDELINCIFIKLSPDLLHIIHCLPKTCDNAVKGKTDPNRIKTIDAS